MAKYLGIDYGRKAIGVAISDSEGKMAFPREDISTTDAVKKIVEIARLEKIDTVVIGDTRAINKEANPITAAADRLADELVATGLKVEKVWEAWSSAEAARFAPQGKKHNNSAAAAIILQRYLEVRQK